LQTTNTKRLLIALGLVLAVGAARAGTAQAAPISCPIPDPGGILPDDGEGPNQDTGDTRFFYLDELTGGGTATCYAEGDGNLQPGDYPNLIDADQTDDEGTGIGWTEDVFTISAFEETGTFTIDPSVWSAYSSVLLGLKSGGGGETPVWAVFLLSEAVTGGMFNIDDLEGGDNALSHAILWGVDGTTVIPEPTSLLLFGSALGLAARFRRRRQEQ
jgi:hypothetical protein